MFIPLQLGGSRYSNLRVTRRHVSDQGYLNDAANTVRCERGREEKGKGIIMDLMDTRVGGKLSERD